MRALYLVLSNPTSDADEDAFNRWYTDEHVHHALALEGWNAVTRYRAWDRPVDPALRRTYVPEQRYLAAYEWDTDDPQRCVSALDAANRDGRVTGHPTLDLASLRGYVYLPITDRITAHG